MDATEIDGDVKLYKASSELLAELQVKLPLLVASKNGRLRKWTFYNKTAELMKLLDSFQEWPQLLDPVLGKLVHTLVDAFLEYCTKYRRAYAQAGAAHISHVEPLPRSICCLLYVLCKVRGYKVILRLLNNEPKYIEPILISFRSWSSSDSDTSGRMVWQERYIMLLWLSHLMLAPFELSSISTKATDSTNRSHTIKVSGLSSVAENLLSLGLEHLVVPSKDREAASILLVRLALRGDMQRCCMSSSLAAWCIEELHHNGEDGTQSQYHYLGILTLLFNLSRSASRSEVSPFVIQIFDTVHTLATSESPHLTDFRNAASIRKLLTKIIRATTEHVMALATDGIPEFVDKLDTILENTIDVLLQWLGDSDTPVRQAVSKALSIVVLKLDTEMSAEVIDAVIGRLEENVLLEEPRTGNLIAARSASLTQSNIYRRNLNAVDPLLWHGAMLSLGHLLFRRSPPVYQLTSIIESLIMGLCFEQRSNVGISIGVGVRDAACFGIWSLSRKYSTRELSDVPTSENLMIGSKSHSTLQKVATQLVVSSCLDPSGNLRRGASAALQELIGRHPDAILEGIPVVQVVDYHAVARRSRAMSEVLSLAAGLNPVYHNALLYSLLDWRGAKATDSDSRWQAASSIGNLFLKSNLETRERFMKELIHQAGNLRPNNSGTTASARQGLIASGASIIMAEVTPQADVQPNLRLFDPFLNNIPALAGILTGRVTNDLLNVLNSISRLIQAGACLLHSSSDQHRRQWVTSIEIVLHRCTTAADDDALAGSAAAANYAVFQLLDESAKQTLLTNWLTSSETSKSEYMCAGRIRSLGMLYTSAISSQSCAELCPNILTYFQSIIAGGLAIETKVNAMESISTILESEVAFVHSQQQQLFDMIMQGVSDYTIDQRGDVGSVLRLASLDAAGPYIERFHGNNYASQLIASVAKLAGEKLTKVRYKAWRCLQLYWQQHIQVPVLSGSFSHQADVSSMDYYAHIARLLQLPQFHDQVILGLISSLGGGTDDISQSCGEGLVFFLLEQPDESMTELIASMIGFSIQHVKLIANQEDREVVPALDFLSFLVEQFNAVVQDSPIIKDNHILIFIDAVQTPTISMERTEALVRLWSALAAINDWQLRALDQLTRKLLHRWPKIRGEAADSISLNCPGEIPSSIDWNVPAAQNKRLVIDLRKRLGVSGQAVK